MAYMKFPYNKIKQAIDVQIGNINKEMKLVTMPLYKDKFYKKKN